MKKIIITILIILGITSNCSAWEYKHDPWTIQDSILQTIVIGTILIDSCQTYTFLYTKDYNVYETNPILGKHPSKEKFVAYWGISLIAHTGISYILPKPARTIWQSITISIQSYCIYKGYELGIRVQF